MYLILFQIAKLEYLLVFIDYFVNSDSKNLSDFLESIPLVIKITFFWRSSSIAGILLIIGIISSSLRK